MMNRENTPRRGREDAEWPYASLLFFGFFGSGTPAGKRVFWRTTVGVLLLMVSVLALGEGGWSPLLELVWGAGLPLGVGVIGWAYARYLAALDELTRKIQLTAFAFSYGIAMTLGAGLLAWALADPDGGSPASFLGWLVLAEVGRGLALVVLARRYR